MERTPLSAREREMTIQIMILRNTLKRNAESCRDRLKKQSKTGWRDICLLCSLVDKVQAALMQTIPDRQYMQLLELANKGKLRIDMPGPARLKTYSLVDNDDLATLAEFAFRDQCAMCVLEGKDARDCRLRNALLTSAPPDTIRETHSCGCEYQDYALALMQGEEVII